MLSGSQLKIANNYNISIVNVKKLVSNFFNKEKYLLHYKNLQLCLRLGLKIKNQFDQSNWLKPYIKLNTQNVIEAEKDDPEDGQEFYRLLNNTIYAKTMENLKSRVKLRLVNIEKH